MTTRGGRGGLGVPGITTGRPGSTGGRLTGLPGDPLAGGRDGGDTDGRATAGTDWAGPGSTGGVGGGATGGLGIEDANPPAGDWDAFGTPGGRGVSGRGSSGPVGTATCGSSSFSGCSAGAAAVGAGGGSGFGTGTASGGATGRDAAIGGAIGGATGTAGPLTVPMCAAGGDAAPDCIGGRKPPMGGRNGAAPRAPVKIVGVADADSARGWCLAAGVWRGRRRTGSSSSCGAGGGSSFRPPLSLSRTFAAVASSSELEWDFGSWMPNSGSTAMTSLD